MRSWPPALAHAVRVMGAMVALWGPWEQARQCAGMLRARFAFPMDLEWMEGAHLYHAYRILHGLPLYVDPARGFATFPYPPLYWTILAGAGAAFGLDYAVARAVSLACMGGAALLLCHAIVRHAPSRGVGIGLSAAALGMIAAAYPLVGTAFDLARSDAMALLVPVLAASLVRDGRLGGPRLLAVAASLTCAIYTKQTNVFYVVWLVGFVATRDRRTGLRLAVATLVPCGALLAALTVLTGGWFWTWLVDQSQHGFRPFAEWGPALPELVLHDPMLLGLPWMAVVLHRRGRLGADSVKWLGMLASAFAAAMLPFAKNGGWLNVLLPVFVLSWPVVFVLLGDLARARHTLRGAPAFGLAVAAIASLHLKYDPAPYVPNAARDEGARKVHALVRDLPGKVVFTTSPFLGVLEGKTNTQPVYQGYIDADHAGISVDYADALDASGADWLVVIAEPGPRDYRPKLAAKFEHVRDVDFWFEPLPWPPASVWKRR